LENIVVWGGIITMNLLFVFISPILDSLADNENREKLEKKWLKVFVIILILGKIITYYINEYEIDSQLILDFINGNLKFLFNKGENPITSLVEIVVNLSQSLEIYLGVISVLVAIYIYSISLGDDFKKYVLLTLLGEGKVLYLTVFLLVLYFFNVSPALFITLSIVIFYELYRMIKETFKIMNTVYFKENWKDKIIPQLMKENNRRNLENIYYELRKRITKAMLEKDFIVFEEMIFYYKTLLMTEGFEAPDDFIKNSENNKKVQQQENERAVRFLYELYDYLLKEEDENLFEKISYLNIELGRYYLKKQKLELAKQYYSFIIIKYKYLDKKYKENIYDKGFETFTGLRFYEDYFEEISNEQEIVIIKSILQLLIKLLREKKYDEVEKYSLILTRYLYDDKKLVREYGVIVLIYFLENFGENGIIKQFLRVLRNRYDINSSNFLQELYMESKKEKWQEKFHIYTYDKYDVLGMSIEEDIYNEYNDEILKLINELPNYFIKKEFILENFDELEYKVKELKLENLKNKLKELEIEIRIVKAKRKSQIQLTEKEILEFYNSVNEENTSFYKLLAKSLKYMLSLKFLQKEKVNLMYCNKIYENEVIKYFKNRRNELVEVRINLLNEVLFVESIKAKSNKLENIQKIFELEKENYFILSNISNRKYINNLEILTYYFLNFSTDKTYIINKKSIKEIIFYLPEGYDRLKYTYVEIESLKDNQDEKILEIIEGETKEEKELIKQGSSILKVAKRMEIVFNNEVEIYEILNEKLKDEEKL
jgi:hypothetical protein